MKRRIDMIIVSPSIIICIMIALGCGTDNNRYIDISGQWEILSRNIGGTFNQNEQKATHGVIQIPGSWLDILKRNEDYSAHIWLRKKTFIAKEYQGFPLILSLGMIGTADETYFNGQMVGSSGEFPVGIKPVHYRNACLQERYYLIPEYLIHYDSENEIAVKIFSHIFNGLNGTPKLITLAGWNRYNRIQKYTSSIILGIIVALDILLIVFFAAFLIARIKKSVALYALPLTTASLLIVCLIYDLLPISNGLVLFKVFFGLISLEFFFGFLLLGSFFKIRMRGIVIAGVVLEIINLAGISTASTSAILVSFWTWYSLSLIIIYSLFCNYFYIAAVYRDIRQYYYLIVLYIPLDIIIYMAIYNYYHIRIYDQQIGALFGIPFLLLGVTISQMSDLIRSKKELNTTTLSLLKKTRKLNELQKRMQKDEVKARPKNVIYNVLDYLDNNYFETYDRKKLARMFNVNEDYLHQVFKKHFKTNISDFINNKRIEAAKQLLKETDGRVIDIAYRVGFDNLTYFFRVFKKITGCTPTDYRKFLE